MPSSKITFTGLLVFRQDPQTGFYEVGVLRARHGHHPHILEIDVNPNPDHDGPEILRLIEELEQHVQNGDTLWRLEVEPEGSSPDGIEVRPDPPKDRLDSNDDNRTDFGWIINLQKEFNPTLERKPGGLQPIILFKTGHLITSCKTDSVDVVQDGKTRSFGFIAGAASLIIDTSDGQQPVLYALNKNGGKTEIFRLENTDETDYDISIQNIPPPPQPGDPPIPTGGHFHMFYELLFDRVPPRERISIEQQDDPQTPSDRCPQSDDVSDPDPDPFRCGGVQVGGGPLGHP